MNLKTKIAVLKLGVAFEKYFRKKKIRIQNVEQSTQSRGFYFRALFLSRCVLEHK